MSRPKDNPRRVVLRAVHCSRCHGSGILTEIDPAAFRAARQERGLSLRRVCDKVGISAAYLSDIELGRRQPSKEVRCDLIRAIGAEEET